MGFTDHINDINGTDPIQPPGKVAGAGKKFSDYAPKEATAIDTGVNFGRPTKVDIDAFKDYMPEGVNSNRDLYKLRADRQGWGEQLFRTIGNTIVNAGVGILESLAYTTELFDGSNDYTNSVIETMKSWHNPFGEVYRRNPGKTFDLGDPAWWFNNIGQLVESGIEFAVPMLGEAKLLGAGAKGLTQAMKLGRTGETILNSAGVLISSAHQAYMEGAMSGKQIYKEIYDTQFNKLVQKGMTTQEADEQARRHASEGAATTVRLNTAINTLMNIAEIVPLFRNSENKVAQWFEKEGRRAEGESLGAWKARMQAAAMTDPAIKAALAYRTGFTELPFEMLAEGVEEVNTQYAEQTGREVGGIRAKKNLNLISDYFDKVSDSEGALNFVLGALGGVSQTVLLDHIPVHRVIRYDENGQPLYKQDPNIVEGTDGKKQYQTQRVSSKTRDWLQRTQYFNNMKDAVIADIDWYSKKNEELQKAAAAGEHLKAEAIRQEMFSVHNLNAVMTGSAENWLQEYEAISKLDNTKDLADPLKERLATLTSQMPTMETEEERKAAEQEAEQLQQQIKKVEGKTEAMMQGFARDTADNAYKQRAEQAKEDIKWMTKRHQDLTSNYVTKYNPHSEELVGHILAREIMQRITKRAMDEEAASISKDEAFLNTLSSYNHRIGLANKIAERLNADRENLIIAASQNNLNELKRMAGKYGIVVNDDSELPGAVEDLTKKIENRIEKHRNAVKATTEELHQGSGYAEWQQRHPNKSFEDYLKMLEEEHPIDARFEQRKVALEHMREQWDEAQQNLQRVKSAKGIQNFLKAAEKDKTEWKRQVEQRNMKDNIQAFMRLADKQTAAKLSTNEKLRVIQQLHEEMRLIIAKSNELKAELEKVQKRMDELDNKKGLFKNVRAMQEKKELQRKAKSLQAQIDMLKVHRAMVEKQMEAVGTKAEESITQENTADSLTRADVTDDPITEKPEEPLVVEKPEISPVADAVPPDDVKDPVKTYMDLMDQLPGEVLDALDILDVLQEPGNYSYDLSKNALYSAVNNQLISEDTMHEIIMMHKAYLEHEWATKPEKYNTTQETVPDPLEIPESGAKDLDSPGEPLVPVINGMAVDPEDVQRADVASHIGDKTNNAMKSNSASIEYMQVEKPAGTVIDKDGRAVQAKQYRFLPLYENLDPKANHNILKPGFISPGDEIEFVVDPDFSGEIAYDQMNVNDEYGMPVKREDKSAYHMTEDGKIIMNDPDGDGYGNIPIKLIHRKSGEVIGYLPRVNWITAQYEGADNYRNVADKITLPNGMVLQGNVEAQRLQMLDVRKMIALAYNAGKGQTIRTTITNVAPGHVFYSTTVNKNTEKAKLAPKLAKNLLPDTSLQFGILNVGTLMVGHNQPFQGEMNQTEKDLRLQYGKNGGEANNVPVVLLPMPNGKVTVSPLYTRSLSDRPGDINTIARVIEAYLAFGTDQFNDSHQKIIDAVARVTSHNGTSRGLDITNERDLETFINQYYTATQHFWDRHTSATAPALRGKRTPRFMLDIGEKVTGENRAPIKVGTVFSGTKPVYASLVDGKLHPDFEEALAAGLSTHYKNVTYTRGDIRGVNDKREFHAMTILKDGRINTFKYTNYNEYLKSFADTIVYGKHKIGADGKPISEKEPGTYVYGANPVINFDPNQALDTTIIADKEDAATLLPDSNEEWEDSGELFDENAINPHRSGIVTNEIGTIEGAEPVTLEKLITLQQNTPADQRNNRTPEEVLQELYSLGITDIAPNFNPFLKC